MEYLRSYAFFIRESVRHINDPEYQDFFDFKIGDEVIVNGVIDRSEFDNAVGKIVDFNIEGMNNTNMDENGECENYSYRGYVYDVLFEDHWKWWCPIYNLSKRGMKFNKKPSKIRWYKKGKFED